MLSDSRIAAHYIRKAVATFATPQARRNLAHTLRRIRNTTGPRAARLVLAELSAYALQK